MSDEKNTKQKARTRPTFEYEGLTEKQLKAVELLQSGEYAKYEVAEMVGVHRNTITEWCKMDRFRAALRECAQEKIRAANRQMESNTNIATSKILKLINCGDKDTEFKAAKYLLDRVFGKTTAKVQIEDNTDKDKDVDIESALKDFRDGKIAIGELPENE